MPAADNDRGEIVSASVTLIVKPPLPVIATFTASLVDPDDNVISSGDKVESVWETNAADHPSLVVNITNVGTYLPPSGSVQVTPQAPTPYTLTVSNGAGEIVSANLVVEVLLQPPTIVQFNCAPTTVASGAQIQITWDTEGAQDISIPNMTTNSTVASGLSKDSLLVYTITTTTTFGLTAVSAQNLTATADCTVNAP